MGKMLMLQNKLRVSRLLPLALFLIGVGVGAPVEAKTLIIKESAKTWRSFFEVRDPAGNDVTAEGQIASIYHASPSLVNTRVDLRDKNGALIARAYQARFSGKLAIKVYDDKAKLVLKLEEESAGSGIIVYDAAGAVLLTGRNSLVLEASERGGYGFSRLGSYAFKNAGNAIDAELHTLIDSSPAASKVYAIANHTDDSRYDMALMAFAALRLRNERSAQLTNGLKLVATTLGSVALTVLREAERSAEQDRIRQRTAAQAEARRRAAEAELAARELAAAEARRSAALAAERNARVRAEADANQRRADEAQRSARELAAAEANRRAADNERAARDRAAAEAQRRAAEAERAARDLERLAVRDAAGQGSAPSAAAPVLRADATPGEREEARVGKACYIPGANDYLGRPNLRDLKNFPRGAVTVDGKTLDLASEGIRSSADLIQAIQQRCVEYNAAAAGGARESLATTRQRLYQSIEQAITLNTNWRRQSGRTMYSNVARERIVETYVGSLAANLQNPSSFNFAGENGIDAGGLRKEFFRLFVKATKDKGLFLNSEGSERWLINNEARDFAACSGGAATGERCYENIGKLFAKIVLVERDLLDIKLSNYLLQRLLDKRVSSFVDFLAIMRLDSPAEFTTLMRTFNEQADFSVFMLEFEPSGLAVDNSNFYLYSYLDLKAKYANAQAEAFVRGFQALLPGGALSIAGLNANGLDLVLRGVQDISVADLRPLVSFSGARYGSSLETWFWESVSELQEASPQRDFIARLLMFWTSTAGLPSDLQANRLKVSVQAGRSPDSLPQSHTCFNTMDFSEYRSKAELKRKLQQAVEGAAGFSEH